MEYGSRFLLRSNDFSFLLSEELCDGGFSFGTFFLRLIWVGISSRRSGGGASSEFVGRQA